MHVFYASTPGVVHYVLLNKSLNKSFLRFRALPNTHTKFLLFDYSHFHQKCQSPKNLEKSLKSE